MLPLLRCDEAEQVFEALVVYRCNIYYQGIVNSILNLHKYMFLYRKGSYATCGTLSDVRKQEIQTIEE